MWLVEDHPTLRMKPVKRFFYRLWLFLTEPGLDNCSGT